VGAVMMLDRLADRAALDQLLSAARARQSSTLVLRGEAGIGKTALLDYAIESASGFQVVRAVGVESEMELAYAALQQLCAPMLDHVDHLPGPQRDALGVAFGLRAGDSPDRLLVGLAALNLLSEVAEERPLLCVIDDAQWLDHASAAAIGFVARRLLAEPVVVLVGTRGPIDQFARLPEIDVRGLRDGDARELLASVIRGPLDAQVRERIVAETRGNPLALLELPPGLTPAELAGGFGVPDRPGLSGRIEGGFRRRIEELPPATQRLLLIAAADPTGVRRRCCGVPPSGLGSLRTRPSRQRPPDCWQSVSGSTFDIRWCARRSTGPRRPNNGGSCTGHSPTPPTHNPTLIDASGTGPRRRSHPMRTSPSSWSGRRTRPRHAVVVRRRRYSWSGRRR
jgi:hypothetical protein